MIGGKSNKNQQQRGFTIVELLIVIVVIGVLAAITLVAFNGIQNRTHDTAVKNDLVNISKQIQYHVIDQNVEVRTTSEFAKIMPRIKVARDSYSQGYYTNSTWFNLVYCFPNPSDPDRFALIAQSKSGKVFQIVDNQLTQVSYSFISSALMCQNAGVPLNNTSDRIWFYNNGAWQTFVQS